MPGLAAGLNGVTTLYMGSSTGAPRSGVEAATWRKNLRSTAVSLSRTIGAGQSATLPQRTGGGANKLPAQLLHRRTLIAGFEIRIESTDITLVTRPKHSEPEGVSLTHPHRPRRVRRAVAF